MKIKLRPHHIEVIIKEYKDKFRKFEWYMFYHSTACPKELYWLTWPTYQKEDYMKMLELLRNLRSEDEIEITLDPQEDDLCKLCGNLTKDPRCSDVSFEQKYIKKYNLSPLKKYKLEELLKLNNS